MIRARFAIMVMLTSLSASPAAVGQGTTAPEPIVRVTIDPPRVVVGQRATLQVEVLAPNYMTGPPALPEFQVRNAVTRPLGTLNLSEQHDGMTYAGVRFAFAVYPQEPGAYALADQTVTVRYAAEPPRTRETTLPLPRIAFQAIIPDAALRVDPFVAAASLTIEQAVRRSSDDLQVGGAVTRTVTVRAEGTPAMLLPPVTFARLAGLTLYPGQPSLRDSSDRRTDALSATRVDEVTYMLEQPGDYTLPAIDIAWWNTRTQTIEHARADTVALHVLETQSAPRDGVTQRGSRWSWHMVVDVLIRHWLSGVATIVVLCAAAWAAPQALRTIAACYRRRRDTYRASEPWSYRQLRKAARSGDVRQFYSALLDWLTRFGPTASVGTIAGLKAAARDPALDLQIDDLERHLFSGHPDPNNWHPGAAMRRLTAARRRLGRAQRGAAAMTRCSRSLNPTTSPA
jgi:hypothetical protein